MSPSTSSTPATPPVTPIRVAVVYHSGYGHTKVVAECVARGAASVAGAEVALISVDDADSNWDVINAADAIIFGAPTYMGSVSAKFKEFSEKTVKIWYARQWQDKIAGGFTNSASQSGDKLQTLQDLGNLAAQHGMIWVSLGQTPGFNSTVGQRNDTNALGAYLGLMTQANTDEGPETAPPAGDRRTAEMYGARIAEVTQRWRRGKA